MVHGPPLIQSFMLLNVSQNCPTHVSCLYRYINGRNDLSTIDRTRELADCSCSGILHPTNANGAGDDIPMIDGVITATPCTFFTQFIVCGAYCVPSVDVYATMLVVALLNWTILLVTVPVYIDCEQYA